MLKFSHQTLTWLVILQMIALVYLLLPKFQKASSAEHMAVRPGLSGLIQRLKQDSHTVDKLHGLFDTVEFIPSGGETTMKIHGHLETDKNATIQGNTAIAGDLQAQGDAEIAGDLKAQGDAEVTGDLKAQGEAEVVGDLTVQGETGISGKITSGGPGTFQNAWIGQLDNGNLAGFGHAINRSGTQAKASVISDVNGHTIINCQHHDAPGPDGIKGTIRFTRDGKRDTAASATWDAIGLRVGPAYLGSLRNQSGTFHPNWATVGHHVHSHLNNYGMAFLENGVQINARNEVWKD